jgi:hypothetical protein
MPRTGWTPSIVPNGAGQTTVFLVVDDFGRNGRAYRETDVEWSDLETAVADLMSGQFNDPVRVVAFNTIEGWSRDATKDYRPQNSEPLRWMVATSRMPCKTLSRTTSGRIGSSRCGWHTHEQPPRGPISTVGPRQPDNEKAELLWLIADEADRGVLFTVAFPSRQNRYSNQIRRQD